MGDDLQDLLDQAEDALEREQFDLTLMLCERALTLEPELPEALYLVGETWRAVGNTDAAEDAYRRVLAKLPTHSASWSALGTVYFDSLRFDLARSCAGRALREDPHNPEAYFLRAILREWRGEAYGAQRDYTQAWLLDPGGYTVPVRLDDAAVEAVVESALQSMDPALREELAAVRIHLEEIPSQAVCEEFQPSSPAEILGLFSGTPISERSLDNPWSLLPSTIILFRKNLERFAADRDMLIEQLRITLLHEIGHHLGLDEDDLEDRGLD